MKRKVIKAVILGSVLIGCNSITAFAADIGDYIYAGANINVRETPDGEVIGVFPHNAQGVVLDIDEYGWYKIQSGDVIGYVASQYLGDEPFSKGYTTATVNSNGLNVRVNKNEEANVLDVIDSNDSVEVTEDYDGGQWVAVVTDNEEYGYVSADHVTLNTYYPTAIKAEDIVYDELMPEETYDVYTQSTPEVIYEEPSYDYYEEPIYEEASYEEPSYTYPEETEYVEETEDSYYDYSEEEEVYEEDTSYDEPVYDADSDTYYEEETIESDTSLGASIAATACNYVGCSYVWGATGPSSFDCSGLVSYVYSAYGISVPRTAASQYYSGTKIDVDTAIYTPGALIFYHDLGHVAISNGDGTVVHASGSDTGVIISDAYYSSPYGAVIYF